MWNVTNGNGGDKQWENKEIIKWIWWMYLEWTEYRLVDTIYSIYDNFTVWYM